MMQDKIIEAQNAGYSDDQILDYLGKSNPEFASKIQTATQAKYKPTEILNHFTAEEPESTAKTIGRYATQVPLGILKKFTWPADVATMVGGYEALSELDDLKERFGDLIDEDKYKEAVHNAMKYGPTQGTLEKVIESKTGAPLEAKTAEQKLLRLGGEAAGFKSGGLIPKSTAAVVAPSVSKGLQTLGAPEAASDIAGLATSGFVDPSKLSKQLHPSGLTKRQFEKTTSKTKISPGRQEKIYEKVEEDFRNISDKILSENKTFTEIKNNPHFNSDLDKAFSKVETLAEELPGKTDAIDLKRDFVNNVFNRKQKGISVSEYEKSFRDEAGKLIDSIPVDEFSAKQMVEQYRKNNESLGEYFTSASSKAANRGKRDALLEYQSVLKDEFKRKYPDSEFNNLFEFTNKSWSDKVNIENVNEFFDELFKGKLNYNQAKKYFDDRHINRSFQQLLGKDDAKAFDGLMNDLLSQENAARLIKASESRGLKLNWSDLGAYVFKPKIAVLKIGAKATREAYQALLDKPQYIYLWKEALADFKKGAFPQAASKFENLNEALNQENRQESNKGL